MEEQKNKCMCGCGADGKGCMCGWHGGGTRMLFRVLLALIILIMVFWFGVKLGELRESIRGYGGYDDSYPMRMMHGYGYGSTWPGVPVPQTTQTTPTVPVAGGGAGAATK